MMKPVAVTISCWKCSLNVDTQHIVEIFPDWNNQCPAEEGSPYHVCHTCLKDILIPVVRPSNQRWEFAKVEQFRSHEEQAQETLGTVGEHYLRFMDDQCEWVYVPPDTYTQYVKYYNADRCQDKEQPLQLNPCDYGNKSNNSEVHSKETDQRPGNPCTSDDSIIPNATSSARKSSSPDKIAFHRLKSCPSGGSPISVSSLVSVSNSEKYMSPWRASSGATPTKPPLGKAGKGALSSKYNQRLWTREEDNILLQAVANHDKATLKWSVVAKAVPGRTGKQCRERFLNHLTPSIKQTGWSPVEDALIFRLFEVEGSKWSMMSKVLTGRTDNGIKNRYHHLKRRLERQMMNTHVTRDIELAIAKMKELPLLAEFEEYMLKYLAVSLLSSPKKNLEIEAAEYLRLGKDECCTRCGLFVPSSQTGRFVCKSTGWCESCIVLSPCVSGDLLRVRLSDPAT